MEEQKLIISRVDPEAFLVKDNSLKDINAPFYCWLRDNGFKHAWHKGHYEVCDWVFVNITHKLFAYGMPGITVVAPIGNHAITVDEFYTIYNIYSKYKGLDPLVFSPEETRDATKKNIESLTYEEYEAEVATSFFKTAGRSPETEAYLKSEKAQAVIRGKYKAYINPKTGFGGFDPNTAAYCLDMMYE